MPPSAYNGTTTTTTTTTPIDDKKNEKKDGATKDNVNHWQKFLLLVLIGFIITLGVGLIGSIFIFFTSKDVVLENFFPTKETSYYTDEQLNKPKTNNQGGGFECNRNAKSSLPNFNLFDWPYSMFKDDSKTSAKGVSMGGSGIGIFQSFKNWLAKTTSNTFSTMRDFIKDWLNLFAPGKLLSHDFFKMFVFAPLTLGFVPIVFLITLVLSFFYAFKESFWWSIFGFFFIFLWLIINGLSLVQFFDYLFKFTILPLLTNLTDIKEIISCYAEWLILLFGLFVCIGGTIYLNSTIAIVYWVVWALLVLKSLI